MTRLPRGHYKDDRIDWAGLSWRKLRGWFKGTQCLSRCDSSHTYGRRCQAGAVQQARRR